METMNYLPFTRLSGRTTILPPLASEGEKNTQLPTAVLHELKIMTITGLVLRYKNYLGTEDLGSQLASIQLISSPS